MPLRQLTPPPTHPGAEPLTVLTAPDLPWPHGFTLRGGGVSDGAYASLNLGLSSGDAPEAVEANRDRLLAALGYGRDDVCAFHQVHGRRVLDGTPGWFVEQADAATSATPGRLLVVSVADCLPLLFVDPVRGAVGAAHCGWRGTVQGLAGEVVRAMSQRYGSRPADLRVAIGPGIQGPCYQVGPEVVRAYREAGFPDDLATPDDEGRHRLDLVAANRFVLEGAGVRPQRVWSAAACTHCEPDRFYSHRRDAGVTGRHWAFIGVPRA
ncbi:MAG: peptidoglycan editing factor PgeF [Deinococcales bacterium]